MDWPTTSNLNSEAFLAEGLRLLHRGTGGDSTTALRRFRAMFGATPLVCSALWDRLCFVLPSERKSEHLLWAIMFLETYSTENVAALIVKVSEKTYRLWVWRVVIAISQLPIVRFSETFYIVTHQLTGTDSMGKSFERV